MTAADAGHARTAARRSSSRSSRYTLRSCIPPKRWAAVLLPCAGALLFGLLAHALNEPPERAFANVAAEGIFGLVCRSPRSSSATPCSAPRCAPARSTSRGCRRRRPGRSSSAAGSAARSSRSSRSRRRAALAAVVAGAPGERRRGVSSPAAVGSVAYVAVFIAIGCLTRRTAVWSLAFVFLVERLLGAALTGIAQISPTWLSRAAFVDWVNRRSEEQPDS